MRPMTLKPCGMAAVAFLTALVAAPFTATMAGAQEGVVIFRGKPPEASVLADILAGSRGLRPLQWEEYAAEQYGAEEGAPPAAFGFDIRFAFDSAELLPESRPYLDRVGEALRMQESGGRSILVAGHADATGGADYNRRLSERRAAAVKRYLEDRHGIDPGRLRTAGFGEDQPLPGTSPEDPANRRVEFRPES